MTAPARRATTQRLTRTKGGHALEVIFRCRITHAGTRYDASRRNRLHDGFDYPYTLVQADRDCSRGVAGAREA